MSSPSVESEQGDVLLKLYHNQTRAIASFFVGKVLMITVIVFQLFADDLFSDVSLSTVHAGVIFLYCAGNLVGYFMLSFSAFLLDVKVYLYGYLIILGGFLYWCVLMAVGFISTDDIFLYVCVDQRCPESHWLVNMRWRNYGIKCPRDPLEKPRPTEGPARAGKTLAALYFNCENADTTLIAVSCCMAICYFFFMLFTLIKTHMFYSLLKSELENLQDERK